MTKDFHRTGRLCVWLAILLLFYLSAMPAFAQRITHVSDEDALTRLLRQAEPGAILQLAEGDYGPLYIQGVKGAQNDWITIRAEPGTVRFSSLDLRNSAFISLDGLTFDYEFAPGDPLNLRPFQINNSRGIHIINSLFDGDLARQTSPESDGFPTAFGLSIYGSADTLIANNKIRRFYRGFLAARSGGVTVRNNDIHAIRMDGMNFAQVQSVLIEGNRIGNFKRSLASDDHADMIQFWTNKTDIPSSDIVIRDNVLNSGDGYFTQSIFMRNEAVDLGYAGKEMFYRNVKIENNVVINAHLNGITVGETNGLIIRNNTVLHNASSDGDKSDPGLWLPQIRVAPTSEDVSITSNVVSAIGGHEGQSNWEVSDNLFVQDRDPSLPNYYDSYFAAARTGDPSNLASFSYLPQSGIDGRSVGASQLVPVETDQSLVPAASVVPEGAYLNRFVFDGSGTVGPIDLVNEDTRYEWRLADGTQHDGISFTHTFTEPGSYAVELTVTPPVGQPRTTSLTVDVPNPDVITFDAAEGVFRAWVGANSTRALGTPSKAGPAVLNDGRARITIDREDLLPFFSSSDFELGMRLRASDTYKSAGELLRVHRSLLLEVTGRGTLRMELSTADSDRLKLRTPAVGLTDGNWHDIRIVYSSARETAEIFVDDILVASGTTTGPIRAVDHWGIELGNPFNNSKSFDGELEQFYLRANVERFAPS